MRTAAAGALAARAALVPAPAAVPRGATRSSGGDHGGARRSRRKLKVAVLGAGVQARMQLEAIHAALADVSGFGSCGEGEAECEWDWEEVRVWARRSEAAKAFVASLSSSSSSSLSPGSYGDISVAATPREAVVRSPLSCLTRPAAVDSG